MSPRRSKQKDRKGVHIKKTARVFPDRFFDAYRRFLITESLSRGNGSSAAGLSRIIGTVRRQNISRNGVYTDIDTDFGRII